MDTKQVIILDASLGMPAGKLVAQGAHAAMGGFTEVGQVVMIDGVKYFAFPITDEEEIWLTNSFTKAVLQVHSSQELDDLYDKAKAAGLRTVKIIDSGRTVFNGVPTYTAISIGPAEVSKINAITGSLKSYK